MQINAARQVTVDEAMQGADVGDAELLELIKPSRPARAMSAIKLLFVVIFPRTE
jgi:hypothetical protein